MFVRLMPDTTDVRPIDAGHTDVQALSDRRPGTSLPVDVTRTAIGGRPRNTDRRRFSAQLCPRHVDPNLSRECRQREADPERDAEELVRLEPAESKEHTDDGTRRRDGQ